MMQSESNWRLLSAEHPPSFEFVLVWIKFDEFGTKPTCSLAYYDDTNDCWRTPWGRLEATVTHWCLLPEPPEEKIKPVAKRWAERTKARKPWRCDGCERTIAPGEVYSYEADRGSGANVKRYCSECMGETNA